MRLVRGALPFLLFAGAIAGPVLFWRGGLLDPEAITFITHYNSDRPFLHKIFDPNNTDFGNYVARELSYVLDAADARVYDVIARASGASVFVPLSNLVAAALMAAILWWGIRRTLTNIDGIVAALLAACLISSFQFLSTLGIFYRSAKPFVTVTALAFIFHALRAGREPRRHDAVIGGALCLACGLLDRQGFFYVLVACAILSIDHWLTGRWRAWLIACYAAAAALVVYNLVLGPGLVRALNGYWPDFEYQANTLGAVVVLRDPGYAWNALRLVSANLAGVFGGTQVVAVPMAVAAALGYLTVARGVRALPGIPIAYVALIFAAQVSMFAIMIFQLPPLVEFVDHRYWYYPLPFVGTAIVGVALWLNWILPARPGWPHRVAALALLAAIIGNLASHRVDKELWSSGPYCSQTFEQTRLLQSSFRTGTPDPRLDEEYRAFFNYQRAR